MHTAGRGGRVLPRRSPFHTEAQLMVWKQWQVN